MVNLTLEKREKVTTRVKGRGQIRGEVERVTEMTADPPTTKSLGKRYRGFGGWGMADGKVEVLLVVSGLDMDRNVKV